MPTFSVLVDPPQMRLSLDGVSTLVGAADWDLTQSSNVYLDGVTGTVFLRPGCQEDAWLTSNSGIYQKLDQSSFTLTPAYTAGPPANWLFPQLNPGDSNWYNFPNNTSGAKGIMTSSVDVNQAMVLECSSWQSTSSIDPIIQCGWGASGDYTTGVSLNLYADGSGDVYKDGTFIGTFAASGTVAQYGQTDGQIPGQNPTPYQKFMLVPCRGRELLVISSGGGGFSCIFADIPEGTASPEITPNAPFWFNMPAGVDSTVRCAYLQTEITGNIVGKLSYWRYEPTASPSGGFQSYVDAYFPTGTTSAGAPSGLSSIVCDGGNPSVAYVNNTRGVVLNIAITGDAGSMAGQWTPFIFGARGYTKTQTAVTVGPALEIVGFVLEMSYESSDSISGTKVELTLKDPKAIQTAGFALNANGPGCNIDSMIERSWAIHDDDGNLFMVGINEEPKLIQSIIIDVAGDSSFGTVSNLAEKVQVTLCDGWKIAENYIFQDPIPLDGLTVAEAYTLLSDMMGLTNSGAGLSPVLDASLSTTYMPQAGDPTNGYNTEVQPGDKGSDWLDRLHKTQAGSFFHGLSPMFTGSFYWWQPFLLSESSMPSSPSALLYDSEATALANGVAVPTYLDYFRTLDVQMLKPEANDVYIRGYDYRTQRPILVHQELASSLNVVTAPASRLPTWRGSRVSYAWIDDTLSDIGACQYAMSLIFPRVTQARSMIEIESDFNSVIPRGNILRLFFIPGGGVKSPADYALTNPVNIRIRTVSARFIQVGADGSGAKWRPTKYVGQFGFDASNTHTLNTSLAGMLAEWQVITYSKKTQWGSALNKFSWTRPLLLQDEA